MAHDVLLGKAHHRESLDAVDRIERMSDISAVYPLPRAFTGAERRWYRGLAYLDDHVLPVVAPTGFLTAEEFKRLDEQSSRELEGAVRT